jgi:hypothetical protein
VVADDARTTPRELAAAFAVLALLAAIALIEPIARLREATFTTADLLQNYALFRIEPGHAARNQLLSDPVVQFQPWREFALRELRASRWPLWNPHNGCGVPLWANLQSAVLSPFTLPFYVLGAKLALLVSGLAKFWLMGVFTYLFARRLACVPWAALGGAIAFTYSGHNALLLAYPHTSVVVWLPAALWCTEALAQGVQRTELSCTRWLIGLLAALTVMAYSGHPETLFFCAATVALYFVARLVEVARSSGRRAARLALYFCGIAAAAVLLACPQILPFAEYASSSVQARTIADTGHAPLDTHSWSRYLFPDVLGTPIDGRGFDLHLPSPNYSLASLGYVGGTVMLLAALALPRALSRASMALLALLVLLWIPWAHDVFGLAGALAVVPGMAWLPNYVSQPPWTMATSILAAAALVGLLRGHDPSRGRTRALVVIALAATVLALAGASALGLIRETAEQLESRASIASAARVHVALFGTSIAAGALSIAVLCTARSRFARRAAGGALMAALLHQNTLFAARYHVATPDRLAQPVTPALEQLQVIVGDARTLFLTDVGLPPQLKPSYGVDLVTSYDALGVRDYNRGLSALLHPTTAWQSTLVADARALELLGVEYVAIDEPGVSAPATDASGRPRAHWNSDPSSLREVARFAGLVLYRFTPTRGRAWLVPRAYVVDDVRRAFILATGPRFDPYSDVVLGPPAASDPAPRAEPELPSSKLDPRAIELARASHDGRLVREVLHSTELRFRVQPTRPQYLVLAQTWFPGWRATIDGAPVSLMRANSMFTALDVPAGEHVVELAYEPESLTWGLRAALLGAVLAAAVAWTSRRAA